MGWKASCIFINKVSENRNELANQIPYRLKKLNESETLETAIMPDELHFETELAKYKKE